MPFSHHSHSGQFCLHAKDTLEEMVEAAIAKGMIVFSLTEHMPRDCNEDLYPEEVSFAPFLAVYRSWGPFKTFFAGNPIWNFPNN